jgi:hypothetical protein
LFPFIEKEISNIIREPSLKNLYDPARFDDK